RLLSSLRPFQVTSFLARLSRSAACTPPPNARERHGYRGRAGAGEAGYRKQRGEKNEGSDGAPQSTLWFRGATARRLSMWTAEFFECCPSSDPRPDPRDDQSAAARSLSATI